ncbi:hypothetical protein D9M70_575950 [compost metagenome]
MASLGAGPEADGDGCVAQLHMAVLDDQLGDHVGLLEFRVSEHHTARRHEQGPVLFCISGIQDAAQAGLLQCLPGIGVQVVDPDLVVVGLLFGILLDVEGDPDGRHYLDPFLATLAHQQPVDPVKACHQPVPPR